MVGSAVSAGQYHGMFRRHLPTKAVRRNRVKQRHSRFQVRPDGRAVRNYLHWLACRQFNCEELAEGAVLEKLLDDAT